MLNLAVGVVGLAGVPDDLNTWAEWIRLHLTTDHIRSSLVVAAVVSFIVTERRWGTFRRGAQDGEEAESEPSSSGMRRLRPAERFLLEDARATAGTLDLMVTMGSAGYSRNRQDNWLTDRIRRARELDDRLHAISKVLPDQCSRDLLDGISGQLKPSPSEDDLKDFVNQRNALIGRVIDKHGAP